MPCVKINKNLRKVMQLFLVWHRIITFFLKLIITIRHNLSAGELVYYIWLMDSYFFMRKLLIIYAWFFFLWIYVGFDSHMKKQNSISEVQNQFWHELEYLFIVRFSKRSKISCKQWQKRGKDETCYVAKVTLHSIKYSPRSDHHLVEDKYM